MKSTHHFLLFEARRLPVRVSSLSLRFREPTSATEFLFLTFDQPVSTFWSSAFRPRPARVPDGNCVALMASIKYARARVAAGPNSRKGIVFPLVAAWAGY